MKITDVEAIILRQPVLDDGIADGSQDDLVIKIHTDEGITGIGETDLNAWVARECIEAPGMHTMDLGLGQTLIGFPSALPLMSQSAISMPLCAWSAIPRRPM